MAKESKRGNREVRKPKKAKTVQAAPAELRGGVSATAAAVNPKKPKRQ